MKLINNLYEIIDSSGNEREYIATILLKPDHLVYTGHFPGFPVTPGVVQLQLVHELTEKHLHRKLKLSGISQCKFLKIINPEETSSLVIQTSFKVIGEILHLTARGENGPDVFFKLSSVYRFI